MTRRPGTWLRPSSLKRIGCDVLARKKDVLDRLAERLARGEISESTYLSIKERYEKNGFPEEDEEPRTREICITLPDLSGILPMVHKGNYQGDEYCCTGVGKVAGSLRVKSAKVMGVCKVGDRLEADSLDTTGALKVGKGITADEFSVSGALSVGGPVKSKSVESSGSLKVHGDVETETFTNSGACKVMKSIKCEKDVVQSGALRVGKDIHAKKFESTGSFRVGGAIKAEKIDIDITSTSSAGSMEATDIEVRASAAGGRVRCETIKGKKVHLEATDAELVEGDDVYIGPRCRIEKVVATKLKSHETARIETKEVGSEKEPEKGD